MIKLLELPTVQLEQRIKQEIEDNIVLEEEDRAAEDEEQPQQISVDEYLREDDTPSYKSRINNYSKDDKQRPVYPDRGTVVAGVPDRTAGLPQPFRARDAAGRLPGREHRRGRLPAPRPGVRGRRHRLHGGDRDHGRESWRHLLGHHPRTGTCRHRRPRPAGMPAVANGADP